MSLMNVRLPSARLCENQSSIDAEKIFLLKINSIIIQGANLMINTDPIPSLPKIKRAELYPYACTESCGVKTAFSFDSL